MASPHPHATHRSPPRRILVRGVNWLGDAVMTTPGLQRLRERFPDCELVLATNSKLVDLWRNHSAINRVICFSGEDSAWKVGRRLKCEEADVAVILPNSPRSALESWLARIPVRVGYAGAWRSWLLTRVVPRRLGRVRMAKKSVAQARRLRFSGKQRETWPAAAHQVHEYLNLVSTLGASTEPLAPFLVVDRSEIQSTAEKYGLSSSTPDGRMLFGLNAGAEYGPAKRWPVDRFAAVAIELHRQTSCVWLLTGGRSDAPFADRIERELRAASVPAVNLGGRTSLRELCAVLCLCRVLVTNDTGPMHVAAALGTRVVALFGSTSPELTGPGLPNDTRHRLLTHAMVGCAPCFRRTCPVDFQCLKGIEADRIIQAVKSLALSPEVA